MVRSKFNTNGDPSPSELSRPVTFDFWILPFYFWDSEIRCHTK